MKIKYVEIENILSIQKIRLTFGDAGLVLLDGWNYDDDTANGAGKTAILNSIAYGIYGEFPRKISKADILRQGTKSGSVKVGVEVGETLYEVYRARPTSLRFWVDGLEKDMTQAEFESNIRLTYTQYLISQYSAQTEGLKLISLNDGGKKEFFLQLMNLDYFEAAKTEATGQLNLLLAKKLKIENSINIWKSRIQVYQESLVDLADIQLKLEEADPTPLIQELEQLEAIEPDTSKFDALDEKLAEELQRVKLAQGTIQHSLNQVARLDKQIEKLREPPKNINGVDCPHCNEFFVIHNDAGFTLDDVLKEREDQLQSLLEERGAIVIEDASALEEQAEKIRATQAKSKAKRAQISEDYKTTMRKMAELQSAIARRESQCRGFREAIDKNSQLEEKIQHEENNIGISELEIADMAKDIELHQTVASLFSSTGAPAYILDSAVDVFNEKVSAYTSMIWPNAEYTLQSFKENKSGDIKAKFSEKLVINGKDRSIGALSGGEHRCLSLAVDFAIVDVLEAMFGIQMSPIILDEPFNDLDASNRERVLDLLDKISVKRQIWVVDHASEAKAMFFNVVRVEKRSGISSLA
jgi:DNA repair exonuclease SbcCD ATPase subunit